MREYFVYMLASRSRRLYVGMTSDLERRIAEHKAKAIPGFTSRYNIDRLVWYESTDSPIAATERDPTVTASCSSAASEGSDERDGAGRGSAG